VLQYVGGPRPHADARVWPRTTGKTVSRRFPPDADSHGIFCVAQVPRSTVIRCYLDAIFEFYEARQSWHGAFAFMGTRAMKLAWDRAPSDLRRERSQIWRETFFHSSVCLGTRAQQRDKIKGSNLTIGQMCDGRLDHIPPQPGAGKCGEKKGTRHLSVTRTLPAPPLRRPLAFRTLLGVAVHVRIIRDVR